jgi:hypothetical protein
LRANAQRLVLGIVKDADQVIQAIHEASASELEYVFMGFSPEAEFKTDMLITC